ncbi:MAG: hypothetical protein U5Q03_01900 [Bacteroidota bacterium]|nr:hypothetical protein [Bacteroidota bacterium]
MTYIVQRMTSMAGLFYVLSCYLYLKAQVCHADQQKSAYRLYILAVLSGILALYSKQNAITFPAAWLLIEFFFVRKQDDKIFEKYVISGVSFLVLAFLTVIIFGWLPRETEKISRLKYLMTQFTVFKKYIQLSFIPVGQNIRSRFSCFCRHGDAGDLRFAEYTDCAWGPVFGLSGNTG